VDVAAGKPGRRGTGGSTEGVRAPWRAGHPAGCADACGASERRTTISRTGSADPLDRLTISRDQEDIATLFKRPRFLSARLVTVSEGEIGDLHIGLKGAMNALYLKDLADRPGAGWRARCEPAAAAYQIVHPWRATFTGSLSWSAGTGRDVLARLQKMVASARA
jgi:hypothetical protein